MKARVGWLLWLVAIIINIGGAIAASKGQKPNIKLEPLPVPDCTAITLRLSQIMLKVPPVLHALTAPYFREPTAFCDFASNPLDPCAIFGGPWASMHLDIGSVLQTAVLDCFLTSDATSASSSSPSTSASTSLPGEFVGAELPLRTKIRALQEQVEAGLEKMTSHFEVEITKALTTNRATQSFLSGDFVTKLAASIPNYGVAVVTLAVLDLNLEAAKPQEDLISQRLQSFFQSMLNAGSTSTSTTDSNSSNIPSQSAMNPQFLPQLGRWLTYMQLLRERLEPSMHRMLLKDFVWPAMHRQLELISELVTPDATLVNQFVSENLEIIAAPFKDVDQGLIDVYRTKVASQKLALSASHVTSPRTPITKSQTTTSTSTTKTQATTPKLSPYSAKSPPKHKASSAGAPTLQTPTVPSNDKLIKEIKRLHGEAANFRKHHVTILSDRCVDKLESLLQEGDLEEVKRNIGALLEAMKKDVDDHELGKKQEFITEINNAMRAYNEAVKEYQSKCPLELQKKSLMVSDSYNVSSKSSAQLKQRLIIVKGRTTELQEEIGRLPAIIAKGERMAAEAEALSALRAAEAKAKAEIFNALVSDCKKLIVNYNQAVKDWNSSAKALDLKKTLKEESIIISGYNEARLQSMIMELPKKTKELQAELLSKQAEHTKKLEAEQQQKRERELQKVQELKGQELKAAQEREAQEKIGEQLKILRSGLEQIQAFLKSVVASYGRLPELQLPVLPDYANKDPSSYSNPEELKSDIHRLTSLTMSLLIRGCEQAYPVMTAESESNRQLYSELMRLLHPLDTSSESTKHLLITNDLLSPFDRIPSDLALSIKKFEQDIALLLKTRTANGELRQRIDSLVKGLKQVVSGSVLPVTDDAVEAFFDPQWKLLIKMAAVDLLQMAFEDSVFKIPSSAQDFYLSIYGSTRLLTSLTNESDIDTVLVFKPRDKPSICSKEYPLEMLKETILGFLSEAKPIHCPDEHRLKSMLKTRISGFHGLQPSLLSLLEHVNFSGFHLTLSKFHVTRDSRYSINGKVTVHMPTKQPTDLLSSGPFKFELDMSVFRVDEVASNTAPIPLCCHELHNLNWEQQAGWKAAQNQASMRHEISPVNLENVDGLFLYGNIVQKLGKRFHTFVRLVRMFKLWAVRRNLYSSRRGFFNSVTVNILSLHIMARKDLEKLTEPVDLFLQLLTLLSKVDWSTPSASNMISMTSLEFVPSPPMPQILNYVPWTTGQDNYVVNRYMSKSTWALIAYEASRMLSQPNLLAAIPQAAELEQQLQDFAQNYGPTRKGLVPTSTVVCPKTMVVKLRVAVYYELPVGLLDTDKAVYKKLLADAFKLSKYLDGTDSYAHGLGKRCVFVISHVGRQSRTAKAGPLSTEAQRTLWKERDDQKALHTMSKSGPTPFSPLPTPSPSPAKLASASGRSSPTPAPHSTNVDLPHTMAFEHFVLLPLNEADGKLCPEDLKLFDSTLQNQLTNSGLFRIPGLYVNAELAGNAQAEKSKTSLLPSRPSSARANTANNVDFEEEEEEEYTVYEPPAMNSSMSPLNFWPSPHLPPVSAESVKMLWTLCNKWTFDKPDVANHNSEVAVDFINGVDPGNLWELPQLAGIFLLIRFSNVTVDNAVAYAHKLKARLEPFKERPNATVGQIYKCLTDYYYHQPKGHVQMRPNGLRPSALSPLSQSLIPELLHQLRPYIEAVNHQMRAAAPKPYPHHPPSSLPYPYYPASTPTFTPSQMHYYHMSPQMMHATPHMMHTTPHMVPTTPYNRSATYPPGSQPVSRAATTSTLPTRMSATQRVVNALATGSPPRSPSSPGKKSSSKKST